MTPRQRIIAELGKYPMTVRDLSKSFRVSEKEVISHMGHVAKSIHPPKRLVIEPSSCNKCGFVFSDRRRFSSPAAVLSAGLKELTRRYLG